MSQCFVPRSTSLHITGPTQSPRDDNSHPATIACTRLVVAGSAWKNIAQVVGNCSGITDGDNRKYFEDILNGYDRHYYYDVKNWFSVVKLVQDLGANGFQPSCDTQLININNIIGIIDIWQNNFITSKSYNNNCNNNHSQDGRMSPMSTQGRNRRLRIQCLL